MVGGNHGGGVTLRVSKQGLITSLASAGFDALVLVHRYRDHPTGQRQASDDLLAVCCPVRAVCLELMIDMHHTQARPQPGLNQQVQQQGGIQPTTEGEQQGPGRGLLCQIRNQWRLWHRGCHHYCGNRQG